MCYPCGTMAIENCRLKWHSCDALENRERKKREKYKNCGKKWQVHKFCLTFKGLCCKLFMKKLKYFFYFLQSIIRWQKLLILPKETHVQKLPKKN
jgi:hypothetical protein